jgi:F-type H+-transporting ATPase subunit b
VTNRFFRLTLMSAIAILVMPCLVLFQVSAQETEHPDKTETPAKAEVEGLTEHATDPTHAGGSHDSGEHELDPTHANLSEDGENAVEWRSEKAIASLIVFGLLLAGLSAVAWKPIMAGLEKREKGIADNIANAQKASEEAMAKLAAYEAKIANANQEAMQLLTDARKDAESAGQKLIAIAQEEAARQRDRAVADIEAAKRVALSELANQSTEIAMSLAQRVVGREVKAADHQGLIQDMLSKVPSQN